MNILEFRKKFELGEIAKNDFINEMHKSHLLLSDYASLVAISFVKEINIVSGEVTMRTPEDVSMLCNFDDKSNLPLCLLTFGDCEKEERNMCFKLVKDGDVFFDIGANYGWYSLHVAKKYPNSKIYSFEPMPRTFDFLKRNIELNNFSNVNAFNNGIGKENAEVEFFFNKEHSGASSMKNILENTAAEKITATILTLDSFCKENKIDRLDFIKLDIEGAEFFALQGANDVLQKFKPICFVEMLRKWSAKFGYHPNDIIEFMENLGYACFEIKNGKLSKFETMTEETISTNFYFLHKEKHIGLLET